MKNCIYFFTGTGNCLKLAEDIGGSLPDSKIIAVRNGMDMNVPSGCERIGFIYPVYYLGLPAIVERFIQDARFPEQGGAYYFAVATYGAIYGNSIQQLSQLLRKQNVTLNYGSTLKMFSNCVTLYNMSKKVKEITEKSERDAIPIVRQIKEKQDSLIGPFNRLLHWYYTKQIQRVHDIDQGFHVNGDCISCGICRDVCAASNIELLDGKPVFLRHCEHCTACIQHCPKRAINYKNRTQKRRRYTHPQVGYEKISLYHK